jgi:hypothetical protein
MLVDEAEGGRVDGDGEPASGRGEDAALRVDDLPAWGGEVDQAEGLALRGRREMRPANDLQGPQAQRKQSKEPDRGEPDDADADEEAGAAVEVRSRDRNGANAEAPRNADRAPTGGMGNEVAQTGAVVVSWLSMPG